MKKPVKSTFFHNSADDLYLVPRADPALLQDLGEDPLAGHDAVPDREENMTAVVADLPDLGYAQERLADPEFRADRQGRQVDPLGRDVFGEIAEADLQPFFPYFSARRLTCLPVPACASPCSPQLSRR